LTASSDPFVALSGVDERVRRTQLDSGVRVVSDPTPGAASAAVSIWIGAGSRDEPAESAGAFHFLEHLLFKGTSRRSAHELNMAIDGVGGELNAFTSKESTAFFARVPASDAAMAVDLLAEMVSEPALDADDVDGEREVILEELAMVNDAPDELAASLLDEAVFPDHGLGWEVLGRPETLEGLGRESLAEIHERWYRGATLVVAAAGAVDHEQLVDQVATWFPHATTDGPARTRPTAAPLGESSVERDSEQVHVALGWRGLPVDDPDRWALAVLLHVLGDGPSSRLYQEVRDERGLAYSIGSGQASYSDAGMVTVSYGATSRHTAEVAEVVDAQLAAILADGVTTEELRVAQGYLRGSLLLALEDAGSRMARLGGGELARGGIEPVADALQGYAKVTNDDVRRIGERIFTAPRTAVSVGPIG
jgi:predicted Zn-dependent peptidase